MKLLPGFTTRAAYANFPVKDSDSFLVQLSLPTQDCSNTSSSFSLSGRRRTYIYCELSSNPKKLRRVDGPSTFSIAKGNLSLEKIAIKV